MLKISAKLLFRQIKWIPLLWGIFASNSALAVPLSANPEMGVVISKDNFRQLPEISARLQNAGINYCILDTREWLGEQDLKQIRVLFIPNVSNLTGEQVLSLSHWMNNGGKVIVSGPTGKMSTPEVQSTLKNILGAYWGFAVTKPSTLIIQNQNIAENQKELSSTLIGGVIIPSDIESKTLAIWMAEGKAPAVIQNDQTTYFGWRWGMDNVASANFDTAWLNVALKEYGINPASNLTKSEVKTTAESCQNSHTSKVNTNSTTLVSVNNVQPNPNNKKKPLSSNNVQPNPSNKKKPLSSNNVQPNPNNKKKPLSSNSAKTSTVVKSPAINPSTTAKKPQPINKIPSKTTIARTSNTAQVLEKQITEMVTELESLIYRVESALITAESKQLKYNASTSQLADQVLKTKSSENININFSDKNAHKVLLSAKQTIQNFPQLANQDYALAREGWLTARRNLWDSYPIDRSISQSEIRAMWLDRGTIVKANSKQELTPIFDRMAEAGINIVFFETINASYPIYPSQVAPEQNPLTKGWDPLQAAIELAHERGMELHAWAWIFAAANQGHNAIINKPENYLGPVLSRHPNWVLKDQNGEVFNRTPGFKKAFFDPANPEVRKYLSALLQEIVTNYQVDGVQLDYIRYPFQDGITKQNFGYTDVGRQLFKQRYGVDPQDLKPNSPQWEAWNTFRVQQIDSFVVETSQNLKRQRPDLILSTAVFPIERKERLNVIQQNWEEWLGGEWVDLMVLMTYAMHTGSFAERVKPVYDYSQEFSGLIIPGIRLLKVPDTETVDQMQLLRNMPTNGFALFAAENFDPSLQAIFKETQGNTHNQQISETDPIPHRQPFISASARYQNLRQEWNFLLINHQIMIEPHFLKEWSRSVDLISDRLDKLAKNPTNANCEAAQTQLSEFREKLPQYLNKKNEKYSFQLDSWQNRLITVENLLNYGQRTILANSPRKNTNAFNK